MSLKIYVTCNVSPQALSVPLPGGGRGEEQGEQSSWGVRMPVYYFQQLSLTHSVTLPRSQLCFPCWGKIRGGKACTFPRHGSPGIRVTPCSPQTSAVSGLADSDAKMLRFGFKGL